MPFDRDGGKVSMKDAYDAWEPFAVALLESTAKRYGDVVTYKQLSEFVQDKTGVTHNGLITNWIGDLLGRVISHCVAKDLPQLSALCVTSEGSVGEGYRFAVIAENSGRGDDADVTLDQLDDRAAVTRLECYRYFGAELPPGGGEPALTPQVKARRDYKRAKARQDAPAKYCEVHRTQLPSTGLCYDCDE